MSVEGSRGRGVGGGCGRFSDANDVVARLMSDATSMASVKVRLTVTFVGVDMRSSGITGVR